MSTTHRHLETLVDRGYLVTEPEGYLLSSQFLDLGQFAQGWRPEYRLAREKVRELAAETNERAQFTVEENGWAVCVHRQLGDHAVETDTYPGSASPSTPAPRLAILSKLPPEDVDEILAGRELEACTPETITDREALRESPKRGGTASTIRGIIEGLRAVGAPILGPEKEVIGALSISGPINRMRGDRFDDELPTLAVGTTNELELEIAYQ